MHYYKPVSDIKIGSHIGVKTSMRSTDSSIKYYNVDDIEDMLKNKCFESLYEVYGKDKELGNEQYVKVFFDIDKTKYNKNNIVKYENFTLEHFKSIHDNALEFIKSTFNCTDNDIVISESHNKNDGNTYDDCLKFSEHIIIHNRKSKMCTLRNWMLDNKKVLEDLNIDTCIYPDKGRTFRMVNTSKDNQNRPLNIINGDIHQHLITYVNDIPDDNIWNYTRIKDSKDIKVKNSKLKNNISKIDNTISLDEEVLESNISDIPIKSLLLLLDNTKYSKYEDWIKILLIYKDNNGDFEDFNEWCKSIPNYISKNDVLNYWNNAKPDGRLTIRSLHYFARIDNPESYKSLLFNNCSILDYIKKNGRIEEKFITDSNLSDLFYLILSLSKQKMITTGIDEWFLFDDITSLWTEGKDIVFITFIEIYIRPLLKNKLRLVKFYKENKEKNDYLNDEEEDEIIVKEDKKEDKEINSFYVKLIVYINLFEKTAKRNAIKPILFARLYDSTLLNKFDSNPMLLNCANGVYDFTTKSLRKRTYDDYVLKNTNVNYNINLTSNDQIIGIIFSLFKSVIPDSKELDYTIKTLASTLIGINPLEKIYMWQGSGRNGKSLLMLFTKSVLGNYSIIAHNCIIDANEQIDKSFMNNLKGARLVIFNEILKGATLRTNVLKGLSGNDEQTTRELFKSSTTWKPICKMFLLSNGDLNIDSIDEALWMRIQINKFKVWFKDNPNPNSPYEAQIDKTLKFTLETDEYKEALLWLLIQYANELNDNEFEIDVPTSILDNNNTIRSSSDSYTKWFNETYYIDHSEIVLTEEICKSRQLSTLWDSYKKSTFFEKRKHTKTDLKRALEILGLECVDKYQPHLIDKLGNKKQYLFRSYFKGILLDDD